MKLTRNILCAFRLCYDCPLWKTPENGSAKKIKIPYSYCNYILGKYNWTYDTLPKNFQGGKFLVGNTHLDSSVIKDICGEKIYNELIEFYLNKMFNHKLDD